MNNKKVGNAGENLAMSILHGMGINMVREISTPVLVTPYRNNRGKIVPGAFRIKYKKKVVGDIKGILGDTGISVLAEVKTYTSGNLLYSYLEDHQHGDLLLHHELNGISLLVWNHGSGVYVMRYPIEGFVPRKSITPERAAELDYETRNWISWAIEKAVVYFTGVDV